MYIHVHAGMWCHGDYQWLAVSQCRMILWISKFNVKWTGTQRQKTAYLRANWATNYNITTPKIYFRKNDLYAWKTAYMYLYASQWALLPHPITSGSPVAVSLQITYLQMYIHDSSWWDLILAETALEVVFVGYVVCAFAYTSTLFPPSLDGHSTPPDDYNESWKQETLCVYKHTYIGHLHVMRSVTWCALPPTLPTAAPLRWTNWLGNSVGRPKVIH